MKEVNPRKRTWLVLSYFFGIDGMACSQHIDDRIAHFVQNGIQPVLITSIFCKRLPSIYQARVPSSAPSGMLFEARHLLRKTMLMKIFQKLITLPLLPFYLLEKLVIDLDSQWSWFPLVALRGFFICRKLQPELIYSTGGPASAHLAAAMIAKLTKIPWIAELQDPLVHHQWPRSRRSLKIFMWLERLIVRRADAVIFLTRTASEVSASRTGLSLNTRVVYAGGNSEIFPNTDYFRGEFCRFAHLGSLGSTRNLKVFLEAVERAISADPQLEKIIRVDVYGTCDPLSRECIKAFRYPNVIGNTGRLSRKDALERMVRTDVLVLIMNTQGIWTETIPAKTYEYLLAGRPILALTHKNEELEELLISQGHTVADAMDSEDVSEKLIELCRRWKKDELTSNQSGTRPSVAQASREIVSIADEVLASRAACFKEFSNTEE
jgi:hypothetical protein